MAESPSEALIANVRRWATRAESKGEADILVFFARKMATDYEASVACNLRLEAAIHSLTKAVEP